MRYIFLSYWVIELLSYWVAQSELVVEIHPLLCDNIRTKSSLKRWMTNSAMAIELERWMAKTIWRNHFSGLFPKGSLCETHHFKLWFQVWVTTFNQAGACERKNWWKTPHRGELFVENWPKNQFSAVGTISIERTYGTGRLSISTFYK